MSIDLSSIDLSSIDLRQALIEQGYCVARKVLDTEMICYLQQCAVDALNEVSAEHRRRNRSQGSLINLSDYPLFADLIACPALMQLFHSLAFANPIFSSGYIISKPAQSPALFWHQDWWGWDDSLSYSDTIAQVFIMIYLTETSPENGCLRVVPGSHKHRHSLHQASAAHGEALSKVDNPDDPLYQSVAQQVAVPVSCGDIVIGDARLLHGAYANQSAQERTLLTLWYHPDFAALPASMQARIQQIFYRRDVDTDPESVHHAVMSEWPSAQRAKIEHLLPLGKTDAQPHPWNRQPNLDLLNNKG